jgi:hypothetical protein
MNQQRKSIVFCCRIYIVCIVLLLTGCAAEVEGALYQDGSADLALEASLQPRMESLIKGFSMIMGDPSAAPSDQPILDATEITKSLSAAPGIASVYMQNLSSASIAGTIKISKVDQFLLLPNSQTGERFITYIPAGPSAEGRLTIGLNSAIGNRVMSLFSEKVRAYMAALMAPVATGEKLYKSQYLDLVASIYTKPVADEIAAARINVTITFAGPITAVRGGTFSGNQARFEIPLTDLLVLTPPLYYEVTWK